MNRLRSAAAAVPFWVESSFAVGADGALRAGRRNIAARTPQEIFAHLAEVLIKGDIDGIVSDYADDAVFITPSGIRQGKAGVREGFEELLGAVPNADLDVPVTLFVDDLLFIERSARSAGSSDRDGVDTFVFRDGLIRAQTVRYTVDPTA